jgi:hypothetical protein
MKIKTFILFFTYFNFIIYFIIRLPYITILSLGKDAAAKLVGGEGTRADICELLKES